MNKALGTVGTYRNDYSTDEEFMFNIEIGHIKQEIVVERFKKTFRKYFGVEPVIKDNGVDNSGRFVKYASSKADVIINNVLFEIKTQEKLSNTIYMKKSNVKSYIKQKAHVLIVNGFNHQPSTKYTIIKPEHLKEIYNNSDTILWYGNYKPTLVLNSKLFSWEPLEPIDENHRLFKQLHEKRVEYYNFRQQLKRGGIA